MGARGERKEAREHRARQESTQSGRRSGHTKAMAVCIHTSLVLVEDGHGAFGSRVKRVESTGGVGLMRENDCSPIAMRLPHENPAAASDAGWNSN
jgi:hypothetical protein